MFRSLNLKNFKNFRNATLQLGGLTVLVGANASGKSNIREAFRFLHGIGRGYSLADIIGEKRGPGGELQWGGIRGGVSEIAFSGTNEFELDLDFDGAEMEDYLYAICVEKAGMKPLLTSESLMTSGDNPAHSYSGNLYQSVGVNQGKITFEADERYFEFRRDFPLLGRALTEPTFEEVLFEAAPIRLALAKMRFFDFDPSAMRVPSVVGQTTLGDRGENLSSVLYAVCEDEAKKASIVEWIRQLTPLDVSDLVFDVDPAGRILVELVEVDGSKTSAYSASDGTLRFLGLLAAITGTEETQPPTFYFFEELENGIYPTRLGLVIELLETQVKERGIQVVATTHSPQLLDYLSPESLEHAAYVYRLEGERDSKIIRILDIPDAPEVISRRKLGRLQESGWLENAVEFTQSAKADE